QHLVSMGHEKIGYLGAPYDIMCSKKRAEGLQKYLKEVNHPLNDDYIYFLEHGNMSLIKPLEQFIKMGVTALFCFNDTMAYEAITHLAQLNIKVPKDILVVGYDNIEDFLRVPVGLTSVSCDKKELAGESVRVLLKKIDDPNLSMARIVKSTRLVLRKTA
ncbi:MAG: substrate-binding domain-containing protein, partial [Acholeplasmataceae bacterium]